MKLTTLSKSKSKNKGLTKVTTFKKLFQNAAHLSSQQPIKLNSINQPQIVESQHICLGRKRQQDHQQRPVAKKDDQICKDHQTQQLSKENILIKSVEELMVKKLGNKNRKCRSKALQEINLENTGSSHHQFQQTLKLPITTTNSNRVNVTRQLARSMHLNEEFAIKINGIDCNRSQYQIKSSRENRSNSEKNQCVEMSSSHMKNKKLRSLHQSSSLRNIQLLLKGRKNRLSNFSIGKKIGTGRFGSVYKAQDKQSKMVVALKVMSIQQIKREEMVDQIMQEIKLQSYMNHPNILKLYGVFSEEGNIYLILQLASECLFRTLRKQVRLSESMCAYYSRQVVESIKYFHSENIIHRDLKPQNIMLTCNAIKIGDFGWSTYSPLYKRQTFCGTLDYVPPQIINGQYYDEKVDIWSLGVLLYELAIGYAPFNASQQQVETFKNINACHVTIPEYISQSLKELILRILVANPENRPSLSEIQGSRWMVQFDREGLNISEDIWKFWGQ